jgi:hypothetical protein
MTTFDVIASSSSAAPSKLFDAAAMPEQVRSGHFRQEHIPAVEILTFRDTKLGGTGVMIDASGAPLAPASCFPGYLHGMLVRKLASGDRDIWLGAVGQGEIPATVIDEPVFMVTHPNFVYGHFLLEMLPRMLWARDLYLAGHSFPFVLSTRIPPWAKTFVTEILGDCRIIWYDSDEEVLLPERVLVPSRMDINGMLHPAVASLVDGLLHRLVGDARGGGERLYLSRRRLDLRWRWHMIENEEAIEDLFRDRGFTIVHPEQLGIREQLALFSRASFIAGSYGSALHNSLFSPPGTRVLSLNWINNLQSGICTLRNQPVGYVVPRGGTFVISAAQSSGGLATFEIALDDASRMLDLMEGEVQGQTQ